jgi:outer membrane lipoprotein SlyB
MEAVTNHESGSARISPLVAAVAASVTIACLVGLSAYTGMLPGKRAAMRDEGPVPRSETGPQARPGTCALCGTVESIRTVEVMDDAAASPGTAAPSALDAPGGTPGGSEVERNARRRLVFRVTLRMDDGSFRAISLSSPPAFAVGDKVRVVEGRLVRA